MEADTVRGRRRLNAEFWTIIGVGLTIVGLGWQACNLLNTRIDVLQNDLSTVKSDVSNVKERLAHIEGWIQGRGNSVANTSSILLRMSV